MSLLEGRKQRMRDTNLARAALYSDSPGILEIEEVFPEKVPKSVEALLTQLRTPGLTPEAAFTPTIEIIYRAFMESVDDESRKLVFLCVVKEVESGGLGAEALLPFCQCETNHHLVNDAVRAFLQHKRGTLEQPMLATAILLDLLAERKFRNVGAAFAGMVCFGDRRVCAVLRTVRDRVAVADTRAFARAVSNPLFLPSIEFCIDWLVDLTDDRNFEKAVHVSSAIASMVVNDSTLLVHQRQSHFGPYCFSQSQSFAPMRFDDLLDELRPMLETLRQLGMPAVERMLEIIADPMSANVDDLDRRKESSRRKRSDRRVSDRRIVNIRPAVDRRAEQRRDTERRTAERR
ncbi:MAG: hypothetical protein ACFHX7_16905 [Pseudomonadota bacterium]